MREKKKIAIIGSVGIPAKYGGFETLAQYLAEGLQNEFDITVYCSSKSYAIKNEKFENISLKYIPFNANGWQSILYDVASIIHAFRNNDRLLILGVSGAIIYPLLKQFSKNKFIVHIDGLEWKREKWSRKVKKFLKYSEKLSVKYGNAIIADNRAIQEYVKEEYGEDSILIEYGGDHVMLDVKKQSKEVNYAFSVCRIEPENNVHIVLEAFSNMPNRKLKFVGNWELSSYSRALKSKYSEFENIDLIDPIYEPEKLAVLRNNCNLYLHGHSAGGTNPSLVEAMYAGMPILAYDVIYNRYTTENRAEYFKDQAEIIAKVNLLSNERLQCMAVDMRNIAIERYKWNTIVEKYRSLFLLE
ncbi:glycosyl transferase [Chitinophaga caeni]|uniref:Glycosyl transferase n=1 Tax=Chitinophaga caeni TaxID=2029983 RepID=A0A291QQT7_9BACT|nr:DUF1972 domain-containing protein [Chitinophaga caeni]ATL46242.1 glycosyl transferase [Chitinophaga caeni]